MQERPSWTAAKKKKIVGTESGSSTHGGGRGLGRGGLNPSAVQLCNGQPAGIHSKVPLQVRRWVRGF